MKTGSQENFMKEAMMKLGGSTLKNLRKNIFWLEKKAPGKGR